MSVGEFCMHVQRRVLCLLLIRECVSTIWSWGFYLYLCPAAQFSSLCHTASFCCLQSQFSLSSLQLAFFFCFCFLILSVIHYSYSFTIFFFSVVSRASPVSVSVFFFLFYLPLFFHMNSLSFFVLSFPSSFFWTLPLFFPMVVILGFCHYQVALHKSTAKRKKRESNVKAFIFNWPSIEDSVGFECKETGSKVTSHHIFLAEKPFLFKNSAESQKLHSILMQDLLDIPFRLWLFAVWQVYERVHSF